MELATIYQFHFLGWAVFAYQGFHAAGFVLVHALAVVDSDDLQVAGIHVIQHALGLHSTVSRVQGSRLKAKREIRIAAVFRDAPVEFLRMICVHELAHLCEREHGRAFYQLCEHMDPAYHQSEFDLRLYLTHLDLGGERLWAD